MKVYINGELVDQSEAKISVFDHGLLYGDGIFEGIRVYQRCVFKLDEHLERLEYSAKAINLQLPWTLEAISDAVCSTCKANEVADGYVRLIVTRGIGDLGLSPKTCGIPQIIVIADSIQLYPAEFYSDGLKIITSATRRVNPAAFPPMVKSLNYLNNIMAKMEADHCGFIEAVMLNDQGYVAECTGDNIFIFHKGELLTPPINSGSLTGITRQVVFDIATELDVALRETELTRYDLWIAGEFFLTGTAAEVVPVVEVDGRTIGAGKPGPVTQQFIKAFRARVAVEGTTWE